MRYLTPLLMLCLFATFLRATEPEKPLILGSDAPALKVITTLEALKKLDPIQVGEASIRLAIEAEKVPLGSGLLVYCLWDGQNGPRGGITRRQRQDKLLGPCLVKIKRIYDQNERHVIEQLENYAGISASARRRFKGDALFIASVLPPAAGKYELSVLSSAGDLVAHARFTCVHDEKTPRPGWRSLIADADPRKNTTYLLSTPMVPKCDDTALTDIPKTLPTFLPAEDVEHAERLEAVAEGGRITVGSTLPMLDNIGENLLVRVFINGLQTDVPLGVDESRPLKEAAQLRLTNELQITLSTRPNDYHAADGDTVELQFLYCPYGTEDAPASGAELHKIVYAHDILESKAAGICLSNKVTIIPGTKPRPAATQPATLK